MKNRKLKQKPMKIKYNSQRRDGKKDITKKNFMFRENQK